MPYSVKRIPGEQVIVASVSGQVDDDTINSVFSRSAELLSFADGPWCHITYFLHDSSLPKQDISKFAESIFKTVSRTSNRDVPIFFVFIGTAPEVQELSTAIKIQGWDIPVFPSIDETMSYVNLKIDSVNLKQSLLKHDTHDLQDTLYRSPMIAPSIPEEITPGTDQFPVHGVLHLEAIDLNRTVSVFPQKGLVIGRRDSQGFRPDVDFSLWQGYYKGVSRRHAEIKMTNDQMLHLIDLDSANGTFLNGEKLKPHREYVLRDGDEISFGSLLVHITFDQKI